MTDDVPSGWTRTTKDLSPDRTWSADERRWAAAYERSLLREWARFPRDGEIYEAVEDTPIHFVTHWTAPFTDGGHGVLRKGTHVRVRVLPFNPEPLGVYAQPTGAPMLEEELVEAKVRAAKGYAGFSLVIGTDQLNRAFVRIPEEMPR